MRYQTDANNRKQRNIIKKILAGLVFWFSLVQVAYTQTIKVDGMTIDLFLSGNPSDPTVMYFPGCNGRDTFGAKYQDFHVKKMMDAWGGKVNVVLLQLVNDITNGSTNGICFWSVE